MPILRDIPDCDLLSTMREKNLSTINAYVNRSLGAIPAAEVVKTMINMANEVGNAMIARYDTDGSLTASLIHHLRSIDSRIPDGAMTIEDLGAFLSKEIGLPAIRMVLSSNAGFQKDFGLDLEETYDEQDARFAKRALMLMSEQWDATRTAIFMRAWRGAADETGRQFANSLRAQAMESMSPLFEDDSKAVELGAKIVRQMKEEVIPTMLAESTAESVKAMFQPMIDRWPVENEAAGFTPDERHMPGNDAPAP